MNVHKTFRRRPGRLLNVLCRFNLRPVPRGKIIIETMLQCYLREFFGIDCLEQSLYLFCLCCSPLYFSVWNKFIFTERSQILSPRNCRCFFLLCFSLFLSYLLMCLVFLCVCTCCFGLFLFFLNLT